jgi:hypothetical protein
MQQRPNSRAAQFLRPKVLEMVERKLNRHCKGYNTITML